MRMGLDPVESFPCKRAPRQSLWREKFALGFTDPVNRHL